MLFLHCTSSSSGTILASLAPAREFVKLTFGEKFLRESDKSVRCMGSGELGREVGL